MGGNGTFMKVGWRYILPVWGVTLFVLVFSDAVVLNLLLIAASFLVAYLFYVPERVAPETSAGAVLSPVDGTIVSVRSGEGATTVVIGKSLFDGSSAVRAPVEGDLLDKRVVHGLFMRRDGKLAGKLNEHGSLKWRMGDDEVLMTIRCGLYALGVPIFASGDHCDSGELVAHLSDGTVELILPESVKLEAAEGDRVVGGYSLLAYGRV